MMRWKRKSTRKSRTTSRASHPDSHHGIDGLRDARRAAARDDDYSGDEDESLPDLSLETRAIMTARAGKTMKKRRERKAKPVQTHARTVTVFISYTWNDDEEKRNMKDRALSVARALTQTVLEDGTKFDIILDQWSVQGDLLNWIARSIERSDVFVPLITLQYMRKVNSDDRSDSCGREVQHAAHLLPNHMVPVVMERAVPRRPEWDGRLSVALGEEIHVEMLDDEAIAANVLELATRINDKVTGRAEIRRRGPVFPLEYGFDPYVVAKSKAYMYVEETRDWIIDKVATWYADDLNWNRVLVFLAPAGYGKSVIMAWLCHLGGLLVQGDQRGHRRRPTLLVRRDSSLVPASAAKQGAPQRRRSRRASSSRPVAAAASGIGKSLGRAVRRLSSHARVLQFDDEGDDDDDTFDDSEEMRVLCVGGAHFFKHDDDQASSVRTCLYSLANQLADTVPGLREILGRLSSRDLDRDVLDLNKLFMTLIAIPCSQVSPKPQDRIIVIIDGLDEAKKDQRKLFLQLLQTRWVENTPDWLGLIVSSRPGESIPNRLQRFGPIVMNTNDDNNMRDMRIYMRNKLEPYMRDKRELEDAAEIMTARSEGLFLYASFFRDILANLEIGSVTLKQIRENTDTFPSGLDGMYEENFGRFLHAALGNDAELYRDLLGAMAVSRSPLPIDVLGPLLNANNDEIEHILDRARQLLNVGEGEISFVHKSMMDFLTSRQRAPPELFVSPSEGQRNLAKVCLEFEHPFSYQNVIYHLCMAERFDEIPKLLLDFRWLLDALDKHRVPYYDIVLDAERYYLPRRATAEDQRRTGSQRFQGDLVLRAIEKAGEALTRDPRELASQLLGRITDISHPIAASIRDNWNPTNMAWLRPVRPVLIRANAALRKTLRDHNGPVRTVSNANDIIVSGSDDGFIRTWSADTGQEQLLLEGHDSPVFAVYIRDDLVASGAEDCNVRLWNAEFGQEIALLEGHTDTVRCVIIAQRIDPLRRPSRPASQHPLRTLVVSGGDDCTICVWDADSKALLHRIDRHRGTVNDFACARMNPFGEHEVVVSCSDDGSARVWSPLEGTELAMLRTSTPLLAVAVDLGQAGDLVATGSQNGDLVIFDANTVTVAVSFLGAHGTCAVHCVALQEATLVSGGDDKYVRVWNIETQQPLRVMRGHTAAVRALTLKGDVIISSSDDHTLKVWNFRDSTYFRRDSQRHEDRVTKVKIHNSTVVSASADTTLRTWDTETGRQKKVFRGHEGCVNAVSIRDSLVVSGSDDCTVRVWDTRTGACQATLRDGGHKAPVLTVSIDMNAGRVYSGSADQTIRAWSLDTFSCERVFTGHRGAVNSVSYHRGYLASGCDDKTVRIWNVETGSCEQTLKGHQMAVTSVTLRDSLVASGSLDKTMRIWERHSGRAIRVFSVYPDVAYAEICKVFVLDEGIAVASTKDGKAHSFNLKTGNAIKPTANIWRSSSLFIAQFDGVHMSLASRRCIGYTSDTALSAVAATTDIAIAGDESGRVHVLKILDRALVPSTQAWYEEDWN